MESRHLQAAVWRRTLITAVFVCLPLLALRQWLVAEALLVGALVGLLASLHTAVGFNRLVKAAEAQNRANKFARLHLVLHIAESLGRVFVAGMVPVLLIGRGPFAAYGAYIVGFVLPLGVSIGVARKEFNAKRGLETRT